MAPPRDEFPPVPEKGLEILAEVELEHFAAVPTSVTPFQPTEVSWRVTGPSRQFAVRMNRQLVTSTGSAEFTLFESRVFTLEAVALGARKRLGSIRVELDDSGCTSMEIPAAFIRAGAITEIRNLIPATGRVRLKDDPDIALTPGRVGFTLDLGVDIPNFFNADAKVKISFLVKLDAERRIAASFQDVDVDVTFHLAEHILSGGGATIVQATAQSVMEAMLEAFGGSLAADLTRTLRAGVAQFCDAQGDEDVVIGRARLSEDGLAFTCCRLQDGARFTGVLAGAVGAATA